MFMNMLVCYVIINVAAQVTKLPSSSVIRGSVQLASAMATKLRTFTAERFGTGLC